MTDARTVEQAFWSKVWRCTHRHPCKKCCWPWKSVDLSANWECVWKRHPTFASKPLNIATVAAARAAYELHRGLITLRTRHFHLCHLCHFGPCCNPAHLALGAVSDNARDKRVPYAERMILLPDGRLWSYAQARQTEKAYEEARRFRRVWAGPLYPFRAPGGSSPDTPFLHEWPGNGLKGADARAPRWWRS